ncbi:type III pantothenate kinase [Chondrinema litorale]|uniref:type III pantothenate kinase n=1 Tax=Chondrinema litorale TaxID=2994555 RepID=UPI002542BBB8|nr:type III pantothenate kinase [Chondrinema litorale]UZR93719.1 type III pantothenate kinase [Chondrinema litorale]
MILVIDIGNTNIVFGIFKDDQFQLEFRIDTSQQKQASDYQMILRSFMLENNLKASQFKKIILSSVVPRLTPIIQETCEHLFGLKVIRPSAENYTYLPLKIKNPRQIGTDLVANALAAWQATQNTSIVIDFGTALTFTVLDASGEIKGVNIAPGLKTAMKALSGNTAQLPEIPLEFPKSVIGTDTVTAIQSGLMIGYTGLVKHMISEIKNELNQSCKVIATGGLSSILENLHSEFDQVDKHLTLKGLFYMSKYIEK